jgi:cellulose biosynthesis protein BcsQ
VAVIDADDQENAARGRGIKPSHDETVFTHTVAVIDADDQENAARAVGLNRRMMRRFSHGRARRSVARAF